MSGDKVKSASGGGVGNESESERARRKLAGFWNERYESAEYVYGTEPNDFLVEKAASLAPGSRILCLADGEGRNSVWLARQGHRVSAIDIAEQGREKALRLAAAAGVTVDAQVGDVTRFDPGIACWDAIVSIFLHLPEGPRREVHARCAQALRPGGVFIYEAYAAGQLGRGTGGPREAALLPELAELLDDWPGCVIEHRFTGERMIREGSLHQGGGVVNQVVARRQR